MKIDLLGPVYPFRGGIAHFLETMYQGLKDRGHEVNAVTFTRQYPEILFPGKTQYETTHVENPIPAIQVLDTINPISWLRTTYLISRQHPDVVVYKYWMPFFAPAFGVIARLLRKKSIRSVVVVDNAIPHERRPGDIFLSRFFLKACHGFIVMSESVEEDLHRLGIHSHIRRISHPVYNLFGPGVSRDQARRELGIDEKTPLLLFFGFIRRYKGLHVLLESLPQIIRSIPEIRLIVAGEFYEDEKPYEELIHKHGLKEQVWMHTNYIPNDRVSLYFSAADVVVQPYISATQSGVAQIAYQFDRPLIVTDVGGLAEVVPHERAGLVVPPANPEAIAQAVIRFFSEKMGEPLQKGVREEKVKYSWDHVYNALEELTQS